MAGEIVNRSYPRAGWRGLDLRASDLLRDVDAFTIAQNAVIRRTGHVTSRDGYRGIATSAGGLGVAHYVSINQTYGTEVREKIFIGESLQRLRTGTLALTYTGAATSITASSYADSTSWYFYLEEDGVVVFSQSLGLGFDESSIYTMGDLTTAIAALADYGATNTGSTSLPAAFLPTFIGEGFSGGSLSIGYEYLEEINQPSGAADPFASTWTHRNDDGFEFVTSCNANSVLYLGSYFDDERKYDGQKVYRSGLPKPATPSAAVVVDATGRTGTNIRYRVSFVQVDKQGNRHEGIISDETGAVSPAADDVDVTYTKLATTSGYNTDCAIVNGNQAGVTTITVDAAHTLKVGDTAYFFDGVSSDYVEREITAVAATTITVSGSNVDVSDNAPISANLRVALYTQSVASGDYYLVAEYPHDSITATTIIRDLGGTLGDQYFFPDPGTEPGLPPRCQYRAVYRGLKFLSGKLDAPNYVFRSDVSSLEAYPESSNSFGVVSNRQAKFTGMFPTNEYLLLTKSNSCHQVIGDIDDTGLFKYRVDDLSLTVGCASQQTIRQISDGTLFMANTHGVFRVGAGGLPQEISMPVEIEFNGIAQTDMLQHSRMCAYYDPLTWRYVLFLPYESSVSSNVYASGSSKVLCFDLADADRGGGIRPTEWTNINMGCGAVVDGRDIYFCERRYSSFNGAMAYNVYKFQNTNTEYDKADHSANIPGIEWDCAPGWEDAGDPSSFKKPLRLKVFSIDPEIASVFTMTVDTEINFTPSPVCQNTFSFGTGSFSGGYDIAPYDVSPYGAPTAPELEQKIGRVKCSSWRPHFTHNTRYEVPILSGWQWEVSLPYRTRIEE